MLVATAAGLVLSRRNGPVVVEDQVLLGAFFTLPLVGLLLVWRRPANLVGWLLAASGVLAAIYLLVHEWAIYGLRTDPGAVPLASAAAWLATWLPVPTIGLLPFVAAAFPNGRIEAAWLRRLGRGAAGAMVVLAGAQAIAPDELDGVAAGIRPISNPLGVEDIGSASAAASTLAVLVIAAFSVAAVVDAVRRVRRATGDERQQLRWVASALAIIPMTLAIGLVAPVAVGDIVLAGGQVIGLVSVAGAFAVAVLKYRLYDLGGFLRRTAAYVGMSAGVVAAVVLIAVVIGVLVPGDDELPAAIVAVTAAVALGPLRTRLQRGIDRLLFGRRSEPFTVLTELGARLDDNTAPETTMRMIVDAAASSLRLPYVAVELTGERVPRQTVHHGVAPARLTTIPLVHRHEAFGALVVGHRSADEDLSADERQLLGDVARQTATVVHAITLTDALRLAQQRLVAGREEERRRIRRDLHDGIGPTLAGSMLQLDALVEFIDVNPAEAIALAEKLTRQLHRVMDDVRRVAHDLRPPALDDLGLLGALRSQADAITSAADLDVTVTLPRRLEPLPAAIEVAIYRIASEALTNVVRHADARHCTLEITMTTGRLELRVVDDGIGITDDTGVGVGLVSMRERAAELGGTLHIESREPTGTSVHASLPAEP